MYRPDHVYLAGGVGIRSAHLLTDLKAMVDVNLTRIAKPNWMLGAGDSDFHAARGAARMSR